MILKKWTLKVRKSTLKLFIDYWNFIFYLKKALDDDDVADEVRNFLLEDLGCYSTLLELKEKIQHVSLLKKMLATKKNLFSKK